MSKPVYISGLSGGIDSQAAARFMLNRYGAAQVVLVNSDAGGNEHPLTTDHILWNAEHIHPVIRISAKVGDFRTSHWCEKRGVNPDDDLTLPGLDSGMLTPAEEPARHVLWVFQAGSIRSFGYRYIDLVPAVITGLLTARKQNSLSPIDERIQHTIRLSAVLHTKFNQFARTHKFLAVGRRKADPAMLEHRHRRANAQLLPRREHVEPQLEISSHEQLGSHAISIPCSRGLTT